jgi:hypothetical protein
MASICMHVHSQPKTPPRPQILAIAPVMPSALLAAMVVLTTSKGYTKVCIN